MSNVIRGYGVIHELNLSVSNVKEFLSDIDTGEFIKKYPIDRSIGGNILGSVFGDGNNLQGAMYEFEKVFFVVWSCGEYIDYALFNKVENK